jgi:CheY-like chemotaxis protein
MAINGPIVIVDDDDDDHYILKRVCERLGVPSPLIFFSDGKKVLEYLRSTSDRPFLILCDVNMPVMNGLDLKRNIDSEEAIKKKGIPFIFFSTSAMSSIVREAFSMSVQGFFIKAQSLDELEETLKIIFAYWERCEHPN